LNAKAHLLASTILALSRGRQFLAAFFYHEESKPTSFISVTIAVLAHNKV
jgi:hypothetical protein